MLKTKVYTLTSFWSLTGDSGHGIEHAKHDEECALEDAFEDRSILL